MGGHGAYIYAYMRERETDVVYGRMIHNIRSEVYNIGYRRGRKI